MPTKLGQNFLENKTIVEKIVEAADLRPSDFVIEIGPGKGILTEELAKRAKKVVAIEIDERLVDYLKKKFSAQGGSASGGTDQKNIEIIHTDILKMNLSKLQNLFSVIPAQAGIQSIDTKLNNFIPASPAGRLDSRLRGNDIGSKHPHYKVIANLPYYITSPIIRLFLESEYSPQEMILMVQKEVAERIVAPPGKMSILSISVQHYAKPEILFYVDKESFSPVPKVDSAVIRITYNRRLTTDNEENKDKKESGKFFRIVRAGFCARRKTLVNNLSNSLQLDKQDVQEKLKAAGISLTARAQELSVGDWKKLYSAF